MGLMRVRVRLIRHRRRKIVVIRSPQDVFALLKGEAERCDREHLWRIDLDSRAQVASYELVSVGTADCALVHPREVWKGALLSNASSVIVVHNHPSGDPSPSDEDRATTRKLAAAGALMGVPLADHIIVADRGYYSFKDAGGLR